MVALLCFLLTLLASPFKSKPRLEAENAVLRHQLIVLQRQLRGRVQFNEQRSPVLHPAISLVSIGAQGHDDHPARDLRALASCWFSALLALEISEPGRPAADRCRFAGADPADEPYNWLWGAPRIHGELLKLGFAVAQSTVAKYMAARGDPF